MRRCAVFKRPGRLIALVASVLLVVVAATVAYLLLPPRQTSDVAVPASNATPEQVVTAYLDALNAHDCDTAEAVMTEGAKNRAKSWCEDVARLTDVDVRDHLTERLKWSGRSPSEEVSNVPVTFDLSWRLFHNDGSMDEGATTWGHLLGLPTVTSRPRPGSPPDAGPLVRPLVRRGKGGLEDRSSRPHSSRTRLTPTSRRGSVWTEHNARHAIRDSADSPWRIFDQGTG